MPNSANKLTRLSRAIADGFVVRKDALRDSIAPPDGPTPWATRLERGEALNWWLRNRYNERGAKVLAGWDLAQIADLDTALLDVVGRYQNAMGVIDDADS